MKNVNTIRLQALTFFLDNCSPPKTYNFFTKKLLAKFEMKTL